MSEPGVSSYERSRPLGLGVLFTTRHLVAVLRSAMRRPSVVMVVQTSAPGWLLMPSLNIGEPPWYGTSTNGIVPLNNTRSLRNEALEMTRPPPQPVGMDQLTRQSAWVTVPGMRCLLAIRCGCRGHG